MILEAVIALGALVISIILTLYGSRILKELGTIRLTVQKFQIESEHRFTALETSVEHIQANTTPVQPVGGRKNG